MGSGGENTLGVLKKQEGGGRKGLLAHGGQFGFHYTDSGELPKGMERP